MAYLVAGTGLEPVSAVADMSPPAISLKRKKHQLFSGVFYLVAGTGLEPVTFGL